MKQPDIDDYEVTDELKYIDLDNIENLEIEDIDDLCLADDFIENYIDSQPD